MTPQPLEHRSKRRRRKIRLAQTAPAHPHSGGDKIIQRPVRKEVVSGPETQEEKEQMLKMSRKKSMFLQLSGRGSQNDLTGLKDATGQSTLPKPNPKTLLDVMIGLNAFSHLPSPQNSTEPSDYFRGESRMSIDQESFYDSHENIAKKFMFQWKNRVASRKFSLINKLDTSIPNLDLSFPRSESGNLCSVPEDPPSSSHVKRRKSKWSVRPSIKQPTLPSIDDEEERKHQFLAWVQDEREKVRREKNSLFGNISPSDKQNIRRKSFICWLQKRQEEKARNEIDSDDDMGLLKDISEDEEDAGPQNIGDLMKTILKVKTRFKDSLDVRVKKFNTEMEQIRKRDEEARNKPLSRSLKRRWKLWMHGIDAALGDSSEEEDNYYHTV